MTPTRLKINQLLAEAEALEPVAVEEERRESLRLALEEERHTNQVRASLGKAHGKAPMGQPLSVLANVSGDELTAQAEADNGLIDQTLASLDAA